MSKDKDQLNDAELEKIAGAGERVEFYQRPTAADDTEEIHKIPQDSSGGGGTADDPESVGGTGGSQTFEP